jgi:hypothetical protein
MMLIVDVLVPVLVSRGGTCVVPDDVAAAPVPVTVSSPGTWVVPVNVAAAPVPVAVSSPGTWVDVATTRPLRREIVKIENNILIWKRLCTSCLQKGDTLDNK